jgi:DNA-binding NtrC family response regulator
MPTPTQAKLLRAVESHVLQRLGGNDNIHVDVRLVAATNKDVKEEVKAGRLREDLFYRLSVFPIHLPPLRARKNDIPELAQYFLERAATEMNRPVSKIADSALRAMIEYDWPGNVRELQNAIRRGVLVAQGGQVKTEHLGLDNVFAGVAAGTVEDDVESIIKSMREGRIIPLQTIEDALIRLSLAATQGNVSEAADKLGISRSTIYRRLHAMQNMVKAGAAV